MLQRRRPKSWLRTSVRTRCTSPAIGVLLSLCPSSRRRHAVNQQAKDRIGGDQKCVVCVFRTWGDGRACGVYGRAAIAVLVNSSAMYQYLHCLPSEDAFEHCGDHYRAGPGLLPAHVNVSKRNLLTDSLSGGGAPRPAIWSLRQKLDSPRQADRRLGQSNAQKRLFDRPGLSTFWRNDNTENSAPFHPDTVEIQYHRTRRSDYL